jgi:thioredoxin 1
MDTLKQTVLRMGPQTHSRIGHLRVHIQAAGKINFGYAGHRGRRPMWGLVSVTMAATLALMQTPKGNTMASDLIKHVTDASFEADVLKSAQPILVDYWAEWCGPCKMIAPILDEVSTAYQGKLNIAKMNVDENREIPAKFGIRGIPTLMLFKDGQLAATKVGALSKAQLIAFIDQQLA